MSADRWFERAGEVLETIRTTQAEQVRRAAEVIADAAQAGGGFISTIPATALGSQSTGLAACSCCGPCASL